jgi:acetoin utilization protein AcuB
LSVWELNYLLHKTTVAQIMTTNVISISEDTPIEEAARIMSDNKIGGLTVVRENKVVGIITETDLFKIFLEMLGARESGIRLAALVPDKAGELSQLTTAIFDAGGNILALGTFMGESSENREVTIKVSGISAHQLENAINPFVDRIIDIRPTS